MQSSCAEGFKKFIPPCLIGGPADDPPPPLRFVLNPIPIELVADA